MLDPITALGVAGNVIQFIDLGFKLVSNSIELYRDRNLIQHAQLRDQARQLQAFNKLLEKSLPEVKAEEDAAQGSMQYDSTSAKKPDSMTPLLRLTIKHCNRCVEDLLAAIQKLTVSGTHVKWQSFRHALSSIIGEAGLEATTRRLSMAQQNLTLFLVLFTSTRKINNSALLGPNLSLERNILLAVQNSTIGLSIQIEKLRGDLKKAKEVESFAQLSRDNNPSLFDAVDKNISCALQSMERERFLATLHFEHIDDRYDRIDQAHKETLNWILHPGPQQKSTWHSFSSWLEGPADSGNIYWITGKPGSGKSTLMRYLADSIRVRELLSRWAATRPVYIIKCFFWNPGTAMQKSMEGLLRTLLYQIISNEQFDDSAIQTIGSSRWHGYVYGRITPSKWELLDLFALFRSMMSALSKHSNFGLLIDGLDEFGVDQSEREALLGLLLEMHGNPNIKLCTSSRPWNEFKDSLWEFPSIKLEEFNEQDMRAVVENELGSSRAFQEHAAVAGKRVHDLQERLVQKASGVFLWLHLVTKRLKVAAQDGKPLRKLEEILDEMPPDLDEFFRHMLRRISAQDQVQASKIFQLVLSSNDGSAMPDLMALSFSDEDVSDFALTDAMKSETTEDIQSRTVALRRRIDSQCMDLLVCAPQKTQRHNMWDNTTVTYLDRTVKDFLESQDAQAVLLSYTDGPIDVLWYKCNAALTQMAFMNKFVQDWSFSDMDQPNIQIDLFACCIHILWGSKDDNFPSTRLILESAVDEVDPLLLNDILINSASDVFQHAPGLAWYISDQSHNPQSPRNLFLSDTARMCVAYQESRRSAIHKYLLVALLGAFNQYAKCYLTELHSCSNTSPYFFCALEQTKLRPQDIDVDLLVLILERGQSIPDVRTALRLLVAYNSRVRRLMHSNIDLRREEDFAKVAALLVMKTQGLRAAKEALRDFQSKMEWDIRNTYKGRVCDKLMGAIQGARKTWIPIHQSWDSATKNETAPNGPTAGTARQLAMSKKNSKWRSIFRPKP